MCPLPLDLGWPGRVVLSRRVTAVLAAPVGHSARCPVCQCGKCGICDLNFYRLCIRNESVPREEHGGDLAQRYWPRYPHPSRQGESVAHGDRLSSMRLRLTAIPLPHVVETVCLCMTYTNAMAQDGHVWATSHSLMCVLSWVLAGIMPFAFLV